MRASTVFPIPDIPVKRAEPPVSMSFTALRSFPRPLRSMGSGASPNRMAPDDRTSGRPDEATRVRSSSEM